MGCPSSKSRGLMTSCFVEVEAHRASIQFSALEDVFESRACFSTDIAYLSPEFG
jgi:hypothetical protein